MSESARNMPPHEQFGYKVVELAFSGKELGAWESDYANLFWQSLEIHNGGFEQWIGNIGVEHALRTLEILERNGFSESHRVTKLVFEIVKLHTYTGEQPFYKYLETSIDDWFDRLRTLNEAYWDDADNFDEKLKEIYNANYQPGVTGNDKA